MTITRGQLRSLSDALERAAEALKKEADNLPDAIPGNDQTTLDAGDSNLSARLGKIEGLFLEVKRAMAALAEGTGRPGNNQPGPVPGGGPAETTAASDGEKLGFGDFLAELGGALLASQRALDRESRQYLEESRESPHVQPSVFRIPKLSAEMKFALEKSTGKGVNLIFFQNRTLAKELHQQSISFEMVAIPPPPDALSRRDTGGPDLTLVLNQAERAGVLAAGAAAAPADRLPGDAEVNRVVILGGRREPGYIVFFAASQPNGSVGVWLFAGGVFRSLYAFATRTDPAEAFLRRFISGLATAQQPMLTAG